MKRVFNIRDVMRLMPPDGKARHLIRQFNLAPNVSGKAKSVKVLAEGLGFCVERRALPKGMGGRLVQDAFSENAFRIEVNERNSVQAQRWAVLHEMGHFYRHIDRSNPLGFDLAFDPSGGTFYVDTEEEREANEFAAAVLFGDGALAGARELYGGDIAKLAKHFGVTENVIRIAMKQF